MEATPKKIVYERRAVDGVIKYLVKSGSASLKWVDSDQLRTSPEDRKKLLMV